MQMYDVTTSLTRSTLFMTHQYERELGEFDINESGYYFDPKCVVVVNVVPMVRRGHK